MRMQTVLLGLESASNLPQVLGTGVYTGKKRNDRPISSHIPLHGI